MRAPWLLRWRKGRRWRYNGRLQNDGISCLIIVPKIHKADRIRKTRRREDNFRLRLRVGLWRRVVVAILGREELWRQWRRRRESCCLYARRWGWKSELQASWGASCWRLLLPVCRMRLRV